MGKQSSKDRIKRLLKSRCPIHGLYMNQTGLSKDQTAFEVGCPRDDCNIKAITILDSKGNDCPAILTPDYAHLIL